MNREVCGDRGKRVVLRWEKLLSRDTAHPYLAEKLDFPAYYGKNLDALYDCLTDLGECTLVVEGAGILRRAGGYGERVLRVLEEASRANPALRLVCPEEEKGEKYMERCWDANVITKRYLDSILIEERLIDSVLPSLETEFLGETFASPVMLPALSHLPAYGGREKTGLEEYAEAARNRRAVNWCGMMENDMFERIQETGARSVRIIKPYADRGKILDQMAFAAQKGALAVGIDIDHIFGNGRYDVVLGEEMAPQREEDIRQLVQASKLPFVVKGVLSVSDALKCARAGVRAIVVSHHHGRMPYAVPPLMVLPDIAKALEGTGVEIAVDCSIDTGADAYKALALGADAVSVGRVIMEPLERKGAAGVEEYLDRMNGELALIMGFTGFSRVKEIDASALWIGGKPQG